MSSQQNILNNYTRGIECRLLTDKYYDYMLFKGGAVPIETKNECLATWIDMNNKSSYLPYDGVVSVTQWDEAVSSEFTLDHIGFTSIDNGFITFDKDEITQEEFNDIFLNSKMQFTENDTTLALYPVSGNTKRFSYDYSFDSDENDSYMSLKGGFFQGIFKVPEQKYEVLPPYIDEDWHLEFVIRPQSGYTSSGYTLNDAHPENKGTFFFIGARAENKFAVMTDEEKIIEYSGVTYNLADEMSLVSLRTNNKHIYYNRTKTGSTVYNPTDIDPDEYRTIFLPRVRQYKDNAFNLFNRTKTGYTASRVTSGEQEDIYDDYSGATYDIMKDIIGNAFALKYNDDGSISYRYIMRDCDAEAGWSLQEETTKPYLIKEGEWNVVNVRFAILDHAKDNCGKPLHLGHRKMKILIYINGYLALVSKELTEFNLRALNVDSKFQECVPFNISLGGGTQGLADMITPDYKKTPTESYYLENTYGGSFFGDIRSFKIYTCFLQYAEIKNNYILETGKEHPEPDMVKSDKIYYGFNTDAKDIVLSGDQMNATRLFRIKYEGTAALDDSHFYVVLSKKYIGSKPFQFTCGGAPMVMIEKEMVINGTPCVVYESGEVYAPGTELVIISDNM